MSVRCYKRTLDLLGLRIPCFLLCQMNLRNQKILYNWHGTLFVWFSVSINWNLVHLNTRFLDTRFNATKQCDKYKSIHINFHLGMTIKTHKMRPNSKHLQYPTSQGLYMLLIFKHFNSVTFDGARTFLPPLGASTGWTNELPPVQQLYKVIHKHISQTQWSDSQASDPLVAQTKRPNLEAQKSLIYSTFWLNWLSKPTKTSWWRIQDFRNLKTTLHNTRRRLSAETGLVTGNGEARGCLWLVLLGTTLWTGCRTSTFIVTRRASADREPSDLPYKTCMMFSRRWVTPEINNI